MHFHASNLLKGKLPVVGSKGFSFNALSDCVLKTFETHGEAIQDISSILVDENITYYNVHPKNLLGLNDNSIVRGMISSYAKDDSDDILYYPVAAIAYNNELQSVQPYLSVNDDLEVVSCNFDFIDEDKVKVPTGCTAICADVFAPSEEFKNRILSLDIPHTIQAIGDNAFNGNEAMTMLSIQDNTSF